MNSHDDPLDDELLAVFGKRLRSIGDAVPVGDDELGIAGVRRSLRRRRRRTRIVPAVAASAIGISAAVVGIVTYGSDDDVLTVATAPPEPDVDSSDSSVANTAPRSTTSAPTSTPMVESAHTEEDASELDTPGQRTIGRVDIDAVVTEPLAPDVLTPDPTDVSSAMPVLDQTPPPAWPEGGDFTRTFDWLVNRGDEFLLGRSNDGGDADPWALEIFSSIDGRSWTRREMTQPDGLGAITEVAATSDRLVMLGQRALESGSEWVVWESVDLERWTAHPIDPPDPLAGFPADAPLDGSVQGIALAVNDAAWAVQLRTSVSVDIATVAFERTGREANNYGSSHNFGPFVDVQLYAEDGQTIVEEFRLDFVADLGLTEEQARRVGRGDENAMWVGGWDGSRPTEVTDLPPGSFLGVVATDGAVVGWTANHIGVLANGSDAMRSFELRPGVRDRSTIYDVYTDGDSVVAHSGAPDGSSSIDLLDPIAGSWAQLDLAPLPASVRPDRPAADTAAVVVPNYLPVDPVTIRSVVVGDLRFTQVDDSPVNSYEVVRVSDSEVLVAERLDIRTLADPRVGGFRHVEFGDDATVVSNPDTGEPLLSIEGDDLAALNASFRTIDGDPVPNITIADFAPRDEWFAAVSDGRWLVHDLPEPGVDDNGDPRWPDPGLVANNGRVVLLQTAEGWLSFDFDR